jgi:hypothetical protein
MEQRTQKEDQWKDRYQKHSETIAQLIYDNWRSDSGIFASCRFENGKIVYQNPKMTTGTNGMLTYYVRLGYEVLEAQKHLQYGYPNVWKFYLDGVSFSVELSNRIRDVLNTFTKKVIEDIENSCPDLRRSEAEHASSDIPSYYQEYYTLRIIFSEANSRMRGVRPAPFERVDRETAIWIDGQPTAMNLANLWFSGTPIGRGNSSTIEKLQSTMDKLMSNSEIQNLTKEYYELQDKLGKLECGEAHGYKEQLDDNIKWILTCAKSGKPLEYKEYPVCKLCPEKTS